VIQVLHWLSRRARLRLIRDCRRQAKFQELMKVQSPWRNLVAIFMGPFLLKTMTPLSVVFRLFESAHVAFPIQVWWSLGGNILSPTNSPSCCDLPLCPMAPLNSDPAASPPAWSLKNWLLLWNLSSMTSVLTIFSVLSDESRLMMLGCGCEREVAPNAVVFFRAAKTDCPYGVFVWSLVPRTDFQDLGMKAERIGKEAATTPNVRSTKVQF
jgi:hypothetical protein